MGSVIFHLAFPVDDLEEAKQFYVDGLGCVLGRSSSAAIIMELGGHQIVCRVDKHVPEKQKGIYPRHFGLIFTSKNDWEALRDRAKANGLRFFQEPRHRFPGTRLEHLTFFLEDPFHNLLEFKHYSYDQAVFGEQDFSEIGDTEEKGSS